MSYFLNAVYWVEVLAGSFLRTIFHQTWLVTLLSPASELNAGVQAFAASTIERLKTNGQTILLERMLNLFYYSAWNPQIQNPIYILTNGQTSGLYIFNDEENQPVYFYNEEEGNSIYLFNEEEVQDSVSGFTVWVPSTLVYDAPQLRALVEQYRIAGVTFDIQTYVP